ncbi:hypothetical protein LPJ57_010240, partial [Coemansia sp. RSA 486]
LSSAISTRSASNANDVSASNNRTSMSSTGSRPTQALTPVTSETQKTHTPFDDDELLVNNILGEANDANAAAGSSENMEFFLNDEESDGTGDDYSDTDSVKSQDKLDKSKDI